MTITEEQIKDWQKERIARVNLGIETVLKAENCELQAVPSFTADGRVVAQIVIVPK